MIYTRETRDLVKELSNEWVFFSDNLDFKPYYEGYLNDVVDDEFPFEAVVDYDFIRYFKYLTLERPKRDDILKRNTRSHEEVHVGILFR